MLLSMLTFGIYALVKSSRIDQKSAAIDKAIEDLHKKVKNPSSDHDYAPQNSAMVQVDGKWLVAIHEQRHGVDYLNLSFDGKRVTRFKDMDLDGFAAQLKGEIDRKKESENA
ncbi:hypothetical protein [Paraburkholderia sp. RL17-373-BIF-A]|uniref:hypothetical protein n=1 Tax=Paraburkholderia sp. RL17-373-BIF-A TaxID=3031629 RepID=UPI0038B9A3BA